MAVTELNPSALALLVVALALSGFLLFRTQRYFARSARSNLDQQSGAEPRRLDLDVAPREARRWEVEMHELARDVSGRLDSKMRVLEHLVAEADRAAARLEAALAKVQPDSAIPPAGAVPADRTPRAEEPGLSDASDPAVCEEVYTLSDYGYATADIAHRLRLSVEEIGRILSLREQR